MTPEHLQQIKERAEKVHLANWRDSFPYYTEDKERLYNIFSKGSILVASDVTEENALVIFGSFADRRDLLAEVERLQAENAELEKMAKIVTYNEETYQAYQKALKEQS